MKKLLITGASSQDSVLLSELYDGTHTQIFGLSHGKVEKSRKLALTKNYNFKLIENFDYTELEFRKILQEIGPDAVVNLASVSSVMRSFLEPELTERVNYNFLGNLLDAALSLNLNSMRIFQASSSEMFGNSDEVLQSETTTLKPISPYGESKARAHEKCLEMREKGLNISTGILFNHESEYRQEGFLTKKIAKFAAEFHLGKTNYIELGNVEISRDWGSARDFVLAITRILEYQNPDDFVIATGRNTSILQLLESALNFLSIELNSHSMIKRSQTLIRPAEKYNSTGNFAKISETLNWKPTESIQKVIGRMVNYEISNL